MLNMKHGGHVKVPEKAEAKKTPFAYLKPALAADPASLLPATNPAQITAHLKALGKAMVDAAAPTATDATAVNSNIPAVYTYWGQFIDHDMTANTDRTSAISDVTKSPITPVPAAQVAAELENLRRPTFDLDSVYGNGPGLYDEFYKPDPGPADEGFYDGIRFHVGKNDVSPGIPGVRIPPEEDLSRDLPRIGPLLDDGVIALDDLPDDLQTAESRTLPLIGDQRNDENLIIAQFHLAVLRFHNEVVNAIDNAPQDFGLDAASSEVERFKAAHRLTRYHYQWLVVHDYLKTVTMPGIVDKILVGGTQHYTPLPGGVLFAPIEYSVAAFRFGHSMVRGGYDHNRNFGRPVPPAASVAPVARFDDLFRFTGNGHEIDPTDITKSLRDPFRGLPTLPFNWIIEWDRMTNKHDSNEAHFARKIDTRLVDPIHNMVNQGTEIDKIDQTDNAKPIRQLLRSLAQRNLLRGYSLSVPTGQAMAAAMGVPVMSAAELQQGNAADVNTALQNGGFLARTPLWFYVLKEAEVRANGNSLGELGSRIVVETQLGLMRNDPDSYLNDPDGEWNPSRGVKLDNGTVDGDPIVTIRDFFAFAKLAA